MTTLDPLLFRRGLELTPLWVCTFDVTQPEDITGIDEKYRAAYVLLEREGVPFGIVAVPIRDGCVASGDVQIARSERIRQEPSYLPPAETTGERPSVTVAVCTRDRTADLARCLDAILDLDYANLDILVVDNAPSDAATRELVLSRYPRVRYTCEPRPGLNRARNRAITEARGEILAFTDDDVIVSPDWVTGLVQAFTDHPETSCVTGPVLPYELEAPAQVLFEVNGSFCRGFQQRRYDGPHKGRRRNVHLRPGIFGTGANMAFRRDVFDHIGPFDPALDVGTPTNGGGDLEIFIRVLEEGHTLIYEPRSLVWHRHRRDVAELHRQYFGWGAYIAVLHCVAKRYPRLRIAAVARGVWWFWRRHFRRSVGCLLRRSIIPWSLVWTEVLGCIDGFTSYDRACLKALSIDSEPREVIEERKPPLMLEPVA